MYYLFADGRQIGTVSNMCLKLWSLCLKLIAVYELTRQERGGRELEKVDEQGSLNAVENQKSRFIRRITWSVGSWQFLPTEPISEFWEDAGKLWALQMIYSGLWEVWWVYLLGCLHDVTRELTNTWIRNFEMLLTKEKVIIKNFIKIMVRYYVRIVKYFSPFFSFLSSSVLSFRSIPYCFFYSFQPFQNSNFFLCFSLTKPIKHLTSIKYSAVIFIFIANDFCKIFPKRSTCPYWNIIVIKILRKETCVSVAAETLREVIKQLGNNEVCSPVNLN